MGDGLVERMNRSTLNLLRGLVQQEGDWEEQLQSLLYVYRTTKHATTGLSPYEILFGSNPPPLYLPNTENITHQEPADYSHCLQRKLLELRELVEANTVEATDRQRQNYRSREPIK